MGLPETEGFDFLSYLLGLQVGSLQDNQTTDASLLMPKGDQTASAEEILAPEVKEKELSQWNPIFPGLTAEAKPGSQPTVDKSEVGSAELVTSGSTGQGMTPAMFHRSSSMETAGNSRAASELGEGSKASEQVVASSRQATQKYAAFQAPVEGQKEVTAQVQEGSDGKLASKFAAKAELVHGEKHARKRDHVSSMENPFTLNATTGGAAQVQDAAGPVAENNVSSSVPELFQNVESMARSGGGKMTVHLSPPELGQVQIQVTARGKNVEIEMTSDNDLTKSVLEGGLGDLKSSMQAQDLVLNKMEVHVSRESSSFGDGQFAGFAQGQPQQFAHGSMDQRQSQSQGRPFAPESNPSSLTRMNAPAAVRQMASSSGRVDIRI